MLHEIQILNLVNPIITLIYEYNQSWITIAKKICKQQTISNIDVKYCFVKQTCDDGNIQIKYMPTTDQIGDIFTKSLGNHNYFSNNF